MAASPEISTGNYGNHLPGFTLDDFNWFFASNFSIPPLGMDVHPYRFRYYMPAILINANLETKATLGEWAELFDKCREGNEFGSAFLEDLGYDWDQDDESEPTGNDLRARLENLDDIEGIAGFEYLDPACEMPHPWHDRVGPFVINEDGNLVLFQSLSEDQSEKSNAGGGADYDDEEDVSNHGPTTLSEHRAWFRSRRIPLPEITGLGVDATMETEEDEVYASDLLQYRKSCKVILDYHKLRTVRAEDIQHDHSDGDGPKSPLDSNNEATGTKPKSQQELSATKRQPSTQTIEESGQSAKKKLKTTAASYLSGTQAAVGSRFRPTALPQLLSPLRSGPTNATDSTHASGFITPSGLEGFGSTSKTSNITAAESKRPKKPNPIAPLPALESSRKKGHTDTETPIEPRKKTNKRKSHPDSDLPSPVKGKRPPKSHTKPGPEVGRAEDITEDDDEPWAVYRDAVATDSASLSQWSTGFKDELGITKGRFTMEAFERGVDEQQPTSKDFEYASLMMEAIPNGRTLEEVKAFVRSFWFKIHGTELGHIQERFTLERNTWFLTGALSKYKHGRSTKKKAKNKGKADDESGDELDSEVEHDDKPTSTDISIAHVIMLGHTHNGVEGAVEACRAMLVFDVFDNLDDNVNCLDIASKVWPATLRAKQKFVRSYLPEGTPTTGPEFEKLFIEKHAAMMRRVIVSCSDTNPGNGRYPDMSFYPEIKTDIAALRTAVTATNFKQVVVPILAQAYETEIPRVAQVALWNAVIRDGVARYNPWTQELDRVSKGGQTGLVLYDMASPSSSASQNEDQTGKDEENDVEVDPDDFGHESDVADPDPDSSLAPIELDPIDNHSDHGSMELDPEVSSHDTDFADPDPDTNPAPTQPHLVNNDDDHGAIEPNPDASGYDLDHPSLNSDSGPDPTEPNPDNNDSDHGSTEIVPDTSTHEPTSAEPTGIPRVSFDKYTLVELERLELLGKVPSSQLAEHAEAINKKKAVVDEMDYDELRAKKQSGYGRNHYGDYFMRAFLSAHLARTRTVAEIEDMRRLMPPAFPNLIDEVLKRKSDEDLAPFL